MAYKARHGRTRKATQIRQRRIPGESRVDSFSALDPRIRWWAEREASRYGCSVSFVINNAISIVSGVELFESLVDAQDRETKKGKR